MTVDLSNWTVSLDLWGTLIDHTDRAGVADWRIAEFSRILAEFGAHRDPVRIRGAVTAVDQQTLTRQRHHGVQPDLDTMLTAILGRLQVAADEQMMPLLRIVHTHAALRGCPQPLPGAVAALAGLRASAARIVLTSNTLATSAPVHRQLMDDLGLARYFDDMLFSAEIGVAKPDPRMFLAVAERAHSTPQQICHVGDDRRTDVDGACAAGCVAVHYCPTGHPATGTPTLTRLDLLADTVIAACRASTHAVARPA